MGFISVTCAGCAGEGTVTSDCANLPDHKVSKVFCTECDGEGSHVVHANSIGSFMNHLEPMKQDDSSWQAVFIDYFN